MAPGLHRLLRLPADRERLLLVHALRPAELAALDRAEELRVPLQRRPPNRPGREEHAVDARDSRAAAGAVRVRRGGDGHARAPRHGRLPHGLLPAGAGAAGGGHARVRLHPQPGVRAREHRARQARHPGTAVVPGSELVEAVARTARAVGDRQRDDHLHRGAARRAAAPVRVGGARRRRRAPAAVLRHAAHDQPGDPVRGRDRGDRRAPVLQPGVRGGHRVLADRNRRGRHRREQHRLPRELHALLSGLALPAGVRLLQHGLRSRDVPAAARGRAGGHGADPAQLAPLRALRGDAALAMATAAPPIAAAPLVRRTPPKSVRRRRFLVAVADHSVLIALSIMFLAPFAFIFFTALMSDQQALSPTIWPHPFKWHNFVEVWSSAPLFRYYANTILYAGLATLGVLVSSVPVAYALARVRFRGRNAVLLLVLAS